MMLQRNKFECQLNHARESGEPNDKSVPYNYQLIELKVMKFWACKQREFCLTLISCFNDLIEMSDIN